ncbi:MAG: cytidylate kinase-like family protein [Candidatus Hodarchaeales archaeon]|jgi:cytidylate kinase
MGTYIPCLKEYEKQLREEFSSIIENRNTPIIAIGGFSGTGKDTVALFIHDFFKVYQNINLKITGAGEFVRKIAVESGWNERNLDEFMEHIQKTQNDQFALKVDIEIEKWALKTALLEGGIFVGRMAPFAIGSNGLTIWLEVAAKVIARRISMDKKRPEFGMDESELIQRITLRDRTDGKRLENIYGISFRDKKHFDLTLRNEGFSIKELKKKIETLLNEKIP